MKMVAIGSSTTSGTGAFPYDSSWVGRFYYYYKTQLGMVDAVYNLGVPGATCYRGMPASYISPLNREAPDGATNVTKAVQLLSGLAIPANGVIIVGYPTNGYATFSIEEIMQCLQTVYDSATRLGNRCLITTTQPRTDAGYNTAAVKRKLADIKDSIIKRFTLANTINFWDGLFNPADSSILPAYSAGDNVHFNNAGHRVLFERVKSMHVFSTVLPVNIQKFAAAIHDNIVSLHWTAAYDASLASFEVQRSGDGMHFQSLREVPASYSPGLFTYSWQDATPLAGTSYYRIAYHEGLHVLHSTVATITAPAPSLIIRKLYVTRYSQLLRMEVVSDCPQAVLCTILNAAGQVISSVQNHLQCGTNVMACSLVHQPAGLYFVRLSGRDGQLLSKAFRY